MKPKPSQDLPILLFSAPADWAAWLDQQAATSPGVWLQLAKKDAGHSSVTYAEALEVALCYGWIDGQKKGYDDQFWLQKFTPRGPKSIWSKVNRAKAEALIERGQMKPLGLAAVESARQDGRWDAAYDSQRTATVPDDFQASLDAHPQAAAFFATLNSVNRFAILFRVQTATTPATRARRIEQFIQMLEKGEKLYP
ncbi:MAG: YdeI/OmpD-associated family protein [Anaerolineae bacterium]|nr:YdeI/OmpD-associated family protein [Anaerolineae bacterium]